MVCVGVRQIETQRPFRSLTILVLKKMHQNRAGADFIESLRTDAGRLSLGLSPRELKAVTANGAWRGDRCKLHSLGETRLQHNAAGGRCGGSGGGGDGSRDKVIPYKKVSTEGEGDSLAYLNPYVFDSGWNF